MAERGVDVDHARLNRWVEKYSVAVASEARCRKALTGRSWRMDETYVKVKGRWTYLCRAIDKCGKPPTSYKASGPCEVWTWDITWMPGPVAGMFFYLYLIVDIFSR
ncbi:MAG: transposase InsO family protein, partial [Alphaproteobacteria bacterium]